MSWLDVLPRHKVSKLCIAVMLVPFALNIDGLVQERRNSSASTMELCLSCTNPSISWFLKSMLLGVLTHWGWVTHICVDNLTIIGSDNGLSPGWRQAIIWTNAGILLIRPLGTNFSEIQIGIQTFSYKKMHLKMSSVKWRPFCRGLNVLRSINREMNRSQMKCITFKRKLHSNSLRQSDEFMHQSTN